MDPLNDPDWGYTLGIMPPGHDFLLPRGHPVIVTSNPGGPYLSRLKRLFIEKEHTMPTSDQTTITFGQDDQFTPAAQAHGWTPAARNTDPATSHIAAASVQDASTVRARVWQILRSNPDGLTHEQLVEGYAYSVDTYGWTPAAPQSIRSRTKELERDGMVRRNEHANDKTRAGRLTHRWYAITDTGEQARRKEHAQNARGLSPEETLSMVESLTRAIQEARRMGRFHSDEMAEYLVDKGWAHTTTPTDG